MADIVWGLIAVAAVSGVIFYSTLKAGRGLPQVTRDLFALLIVVLIFAYIRFLWYSPRLATLLPYSNIVVLGNWFPLAAAALGGLAWQRIPGRTFRKSLFVGALACTSVYSLISPLLGEKPACDEVWSRGVCVQSTARTCTPACAATLLRSYGIETDESEMTDLCLTRQGTTWMGLYRGLKIKTEGTPWDVEVIACESQDLVAKRDGPMIVSVGLPPDFSGDQQMAQIEWGWKPGLGHSVVLLRKTPQGRYLVADPAPGVGQEEWTVEDLDYLYRGTAMRLIRRS